MPTQKRKIMKQHSAHDRYILYILGLLMLVASIIPAKSYGGDNRKGAFTVDLGFGFIGGREIQVREQSMCDGKAQIQIKWDQNKGKVWLSGKFKGLPSKMDRCYDYDPSTEFNEYPECVENGVWQIWFSGRTATIESLFYYDGATGELIGNEYELDGPPPANAIAVPIPVFQMICSPPFEATPHNLKAKVEFEFDYHQILDGRGSGGVYATQLPRNIFNPSDLEVYYTDGGLPIAAAMDMDDILDDLENNPVGNILFATSLEPTPKPDFLASRDNLMIGWGGGVRDASLLGLPVDLTPYGECGTFQLPDPFLDD